MSQSAAENQTLSINSLHEEIIWSIFSLNADVDDECPLKTARQISQVSGSWRKLILTAPTIWGKSLKLSELQIEEDISPWRNLVMERIGGAPLFMKGEIHVSRIEWFLQFISPHWERICEIDVRPWGPEADMIDEEKVKFLNSPPLSIRAFYLPGVRFDLRAPWVANLRSLGLSTPFGVTEILACVANIPRLEDAKFEEWTPAFAMQPFHLNPRIKPIPTGKIPLPHLMNLRVCHLLSEVTDILDHIAPNAECSYNIHTRQDHFSSDAQWDLLFGYIERRINLRDKITLNLDIGQHYTMFRIVGDPSTPFFLYNHSTGILQNQNPENGVGVHLSRFYLRKIPGSMPFRNLKSGRVTTLAIHIDDNCQAIYQSIKNVIDFCLAFPSVSTLELSRVSFLRHIIWADRLFPLLDTVRVSADNVQQEPPLETSIAEILETRRSCSKAIKTLWFYPNIVDLKVDWGFLEEFRDMKVCFTWVREDGTYGERVYTCGSGNPESLDTRNGLLES